MKEYEGGGRRRKEEEGKGGRRRKEREEGGGTRIRKNLHVHASTRAISTRMVPRPHDLTKAVVRVGWRYRAMQGDAGRCVWFYMCVLTYGHRHIITVRKSQW